MNEIEQDARDLRLAEQAFFKQALEVKTARLAELEAEVQYLRRTLNDMLAVRTPAPQPAVRTSTPGATRPLPVGSVPRRWRAA